jgi:hypothetical protein
VIDLVFPLSGEQNHLHQIEIYVDFHHVQVRLNLFRYRPGFYYGFLQAFHHHLHSVRHHQTAAVLVEHHSQQLEELRISSFACRTQAWLGIFVDVDILLGMPNIGYSFFLVGRFHWHHLCTMDVFGMPRRISTPPKMPSHACVRQAKEEMRCSSNC